MFLKISCETEIGLPFSHLRNNVLLLVVEQYLADVIAVIRAGIASSATAVPLEVIAALLEWCDIEEEYLRRLAEDT